MIELIMICTRIGVEIVNWYIAPCESFWLIFCLSHLDTYHTRHVVMNNRTWDLNYDYDFELMMTKLPSWHNYVYIYIYVLYPRRLCLYC